MSSQYMSIRRESDKLTQVMNLNKQLVEHMKTLHTFMHTRSKIACPGFLECQTLQLIAKAGG